MSRVRATEADLGAWLSKVESNCFGLTLDKDEAAGVRCGRVQPAVQPASVGAMCRETDVRWLDASLPQPRRVFVCPPALTPATRVATTSHHHHH